MYKLGGTEDWNDCWILEEPELLELGYCPESFYGSWRKPDFALEICRKYGHLHVVSWRESHFMNRYEPTARCFLVGTGIQIPRYEYFISPLTQEKYDRIVAEALARAEANGGLTESDMLNWMMLKMTLDENLVRSIMVPDDERKRLHAEEVFKAAKRKLAPQQ